MAALIAMAPTLGAMVINAASVPPSVWTFGDLFFLHILCIPIFSSWFGEKVVGYMHKNMVG